MKIWKKKVNTVMTDGRDKWKKRRYLRTAQIPHEWDDISKVHY